VTGRRGRRSKQLLDDCKGKRGQCKLKEEALDRTGRTRFGRRYGPVIRETGMNGIEPYFIIEFYYPTNRLQTCVTLTF